ncbi:MAG TPA: GNAT family N-acetyltransferase [Gammaproteobacteria bacterium]|nr:GNAT family N-acetyltransferase [Gammaproteobacteria bacterium]
MITTAADIPAAQRELELLPEFRWFEVDANPLGWDSLVGDSPQNLFNTSPLLRAHAMGNARPIGIVVPCHGVSVAIGGVMCWSGREQRLSTLAFPALATTGAPDLVSALTAWLFAQGVAEIEIGSFISGVEGYRLPTANAVLRQRLEFVWDLSGSPEQRHRALRSNHKRKLQKLLKQSMELREITRHQAEQMTRLRIQWSRRRAMPLGLLQVVQMYQYHRFLHRHLTMPGIGHLYGLYDKAGVLLSLAYMLETDSLAFYMIGASAPAGYLMNASLRLFWELAERYQSRGLKFLHFGGVPADAASEAHEENGVFRFKAGFGIEPTSRASLLIKK